ncbi:LytR/AlgR family response regulator transcription factor [Jiulongibacter sp. NS-SX5]|uniref:LytR/AlgR family response regulator transcription factor n=1 Tax=Jiulongibacter sp. NS-SX5 TaxID=3463854 RepID=UPI004058206F
MNRLLHYGHYNAGYTANRQEDNRSTTLSANSNIIMKVGGKKGLLNLNDIVYLKSLKNYTIFKLKSGKEVLSSKTLKIFEDELTDVINFVRPHRSYMVNFDYIDDLHFNHKGGEIYLGDTTIEISRRKAASFRKSYKTFLSAMGENVKSVIRSKTRINVEQD